MKVVALAICLALSGCGHVTDQRSALVTSSPASTRREKSALLPPGQVKDVTTQCSRPSPSEYQETWQPSSSDLGEMESKFGRLSELLQRAESEIQDPEQYNMQYAGIVVGGKRLIYINAFYRYRTDVWEDWREKPAVVCDGGSGFWGALYDPATGEFSDFHLNGRA